MVDANVVRILARLRRLAGDPKLAVKQHAALADALLDPERPGDFNQVRPPQMLCTAPLCASGSLACIRRMALQREEELAPLPDSHGSNLPTLCKVSAMRPGPHTSMYRYLDRKHSMHHPAELVAGLCRQ